MRSDDEIDGHTPASEAAQASDTDSPARPSQLWKPGQSGNLKGRPKQPKNAREVRALAQTKTIQMIEVLTKVATNPKSPPAARAAAASAILDRAWGKPGGDFEGGEQLVIKILRLNELEPEPEMKTIEGTVEPDKDGGE
jgi:Family of unknown function (DUF5681)